MIIASVLIQALMIASAKSLTEKDIVGQHGTLFLNVAKKLSATTLSWRFPRRFMDGFKFV